MADTVATQILADGPKTAIMKFTNISDGTGEAAVLKVDVSTLSSYQGKTCAGVTIDRIVAMTDGMSVDILWDATTPLLALNIPQNQWLDVDFKSGGGLINNAEHPTGDIKFTTVGHTLADRYTVILYMSKNYNALGA
jgi:hypothetical protein